MSLEEDPIRGKLTPEEERLTRLYDDLEVLARERRATDLRAAFVFGVVVGLVVGRLLFF